jgi:rhodanese-related sulfurtransferase
MTTETPTPLTADAAARAHFAARLRFETDAEDVAQALAAGSTEFVLLDARGREAFDAGHVPGARHLPRPLTGDAVASLPPGTVVVYCWGPGCNGAVKLAYELAGLGRPAKEMLGGFEYWVREGHPVEGTEAAAITAGVDAHGLVKLRQAVSCLC